jgi:hypothetical protein
MRHPTAASATTEPRKDVPHDHEQQHRPAEEHGIGIPPDSVLVVVFAREEDREVVVNGRNQKQPTGCRRDKQA